MQTSIAHVIKYFCLVVKLKKNSKYTKGRFFQEANEKFQNIHHTILSHLFRFYDKYLRNNINIV